ncbi:ABC transporter substrate-binding protein [Streptomyces sp. NPDC005551]|uniref:ABC transporter substrate-binding protein n=1 Tax=unclassified Streptomyces TaxID=2593676 RepID=UPI0033D3EC9D
MRSASRRRLVTTLLLAPFLSGCFASDGGSSADSPHGSSAGDRLRVALAFPPTQNLSPYGADATLLSRLGVTEGLTTLDANGAAAPALAESWRRTGERSWEFTLREATFQDGTDVTASAVAAALTRATRATPEPAALTGVGLTAAARGDRRVRVVTAAPDSVLPLRLSSPSLAVFSAGAYRERGTVDPAGTATGPFELKGVTGTTAATLDRFDDYWGGRAHASGVDARFIPDGTARTNALRTGVVDIAEALPVSQVAALDEGNRRETATTRTTSLSLNTRSGPFRDPGTRAAARQAIDTSVLADDVYEGYADPGAGLFGPALTWAADQRVTPTGRTAAARAAGRLTLATYDNRPELPEVAQVLKQQLEKAGFRVRLQVREYSRLESDVLAGRFDAFVSARNTMLDTGDPVSILAADYTCDGDYNLALLCDKKVDRAVARAEDIADTTKRRSAVMAAEAAVLGTDAVVPLVHQRIVTGVADPVRGVLLDPYERNLVGTGTRR